MRMNHGYELAKQLIEKVIDEGVIAVTFKQKIRAMFIKFKNRKSEKKYYYSLSKETVRHRPQ